MKQLKRKGETSPPKEKTKPRRKKGPEPWGKKERYLVLYVLLTTIILSALLAASARNWKLPGLPRISLPSFEGTIIIEGNKESKEEREKSEKIISEFKKKTKELSGVYGLYVIRLKNGTSYGVSEKEIFEPASLNKLPVIAALYMEAEKDNLDLETKYTLKDSDKVGGAGSLAGEPAGTILTYRDLVRLMGKQSDNTAFNIVKKVLGKEVIEAATQEIGMKDTVIEGEQKTTPYDIGLFFKKLWQGDIVSEKHKDEILGFLTDTVYESWISEGITDVDVAHKFGREVHVVNDAGIVLADEPFVLVILTKGVVEREADEVFPELAKLVYGIEAR